MLSKSRLKLLQSLQLKKHRQKYNLFVGEGDKIVRTAITYRPELVEEIICTQDWANRCAGLLSQVSSYITDAPTLAKISKLRSKPSVIAVLKVVDSTLEWKGINKAIYLDDVQDPGNVGTIIRIADWYGFNAIIRSEGSADFYNPKTVQSSMGSMLNIDLYTDSTDCLRSAKGQIPILTTAMNGTPMGDVSLSDRSVLVMGHEGRGVSADVMRMSDITISISGHEDRVADSLNVAVATGIIVQSLYGGG